MTDQMRRNKFPGTKNKIPGDYELEHRKLARRAAAEGIVLLKNEGGLLPLSETTRIALYGAGAVRTMKGGTGSGDVNERDSVSVFEGLRNAGYEITTGEWLAAYEECYKQARQTWKEEILRKSTKESAEFFDIYSSTPFRIPSGPVADLKDADVAVYVLSRIAGEGCDRKNEKGDYLLSDEESRMLDAICNFYDNVILIINTGGLIDLSFLDQYTGIRSVLYISQPGMEGGNAVADLIRGAATPSGKLTDSWAFKYEDYPNASTYSHNNGEVGREYYTEGIYVGYRYFDTFHKPVRYGFGYGLSYTTFALRMLDVKVVGKQAEVHISVEVKNAGKQYEGKEVVQIYVSPPEGKLEKEYRRLCGFAKTELLKPGQSQIVEICFSVDHMTSFDEETGSWILEPGYYGIWAGSSLEESRLSAVLLLDEEKRTETLNKICPCRHEFSSITQALQKRQEQYREWTDDIQKNGIPVIKPDLSEYRADRRNVIEEKDIEKTVSKLDTEQCIRLAIGETANSHGENLGAAGITVPGAAGETSSCAVEMGLPNIVLADGPAGLRLNQVYYARDGKIVPPPFEAGIEHGFFCEDTDTEGEAYYQYCTAFPVGTLLAQTWDTGLVREVGKAVSDEMKRFGVQLWLAPGMNIHRNPLCGRNFEYYSEDPLLSGEIAAAITEGVQSERGCGTTIKHFACNNQEDNRMGSDSILSERTLREIYLKGFEIAVKKSQPMAIMTSYNLVNGVHAANSYDLCTEVARKEWGFHGLIMTDWGTTLRDDECTAAGCIRAGNDLIMPGSEKDYENLKKELISGNLSEKELRGCIVHIARIIGRLAGKS